MRITSPVAGGAVWQGRKWVASLGMCWQLERCWAWRLRKGHRERPCSRQSFLRAVAPMPSFGAASWVQTQQEPGQREGKGGPSPGYSLPYLT